jgi:hypothetical protein
MPARGLEGRWRRQSTTTANQGKEAYTMSANHLPPFSTNGNGHANGHANGHPPGTAKQEQGEAPQAPPNDQAGAGAKSVNPNPHPKPYFLPAGFPFDAYPRPLQLAILEVVQPCYVELVAGTANALERQAGATLTFMLLVEVIEQYQMGKLVAEVATGKPRSKDYDKQLQRLLRIVKSKEHVQKFLARLQAVRRKSFFPRFSLPPAGAPFNSPQPVAPPPFTSPPGGGNPYPPPPFSSEPAPGGPATQAGFASASGGEYPSSGDLQYCPRCYRPIVRHTHYCSHCKMQIPRSDNQPPSPQVSSAHGPMQTNATLTPLERAIRAGREAISGHGEPEEDDE